MVGHFERKENMFGHYRGLEFDIVDELVRFRIRLVRNLNRNSNGILTQNLTAGQSVEWFDLESNKLRRNTTAKLNYASGLKSQTEN